MPDRTWGGSVHFRCNICGASNMRNVASFHREIPDCTGCGSTPRFRGLMKAFMEEVLGVKNAVLKDAPENKAIRGIGMTEWAGYASLLSKKYSFLETYFHAEPRLDIMDPSTFSYRDLDFIICSEVLEHVLAPRVKSSSQFEANAEVRWSFDIFRSLH